VVILYQIINRVIRKTGEIRGVDERIILQMHTYVKYGVYSIALLALQRIFGVNITVIITSLGIAGIAVGFAARNIISNFFGGILLLLDKVYSVNDVVRINDTYGKVRLITLRTTQIITFDGNVVNIPNSRILNSTVINLTSGSTTLLTAISVNISYETDLREVKNNHA
jgi:small conductance mechanosensitive channel